MAPISFHYVGRPADHAGFLVDKFAMQVRNLSKSLTGKEKQRRYAHDGTVVRETQELRNLVFIENSLAVFAFLGGQYPRAAKMESGVL